jgi:hypothetical protein
LVVGIFPDSDPKALESALSAQQIDLSKVKVVSSTARDTDSTLLDFVDVIEDMEDNSLSDDMTKGLGIMGDAGGTGVPGLGGRQATRGSFMGSDTPSARYLAGFAIPDDEVGNFDDAINDGRAVVLYVDAGAAADTIAAAFKAAGLRHVRAY